MGAFRPFEEPKELPSRMKTRVRKNEILAGRERSLEEEKIEIEGPGIELALSPPSFPSLGPDQERPEAGSPDPGIAGQNLVVEGGGNDLPGIGPENGRDSGQGEVPVQKEEAESPFKGSPRILKVSSQRDCKEATQRRRSRPRPRRGGGSGSARLPRTGGRFRRSGRSAHTPPPTVRIRSPAWRRFPSCRGGPGSPVRR